MAAAVKLPEKVCLKMLWGGLQPIPRQVVLDATTLIGLSWAVWKMAHRSRNNSDRQSSVNDSTKIFLASCVLAVSTSGISNRWTLTLPMVPLLVLHLLHRLLLLQQPLDKSQQEGKQQKEYRLSRWISCVITGLSALFIVAGAALSVLFPAVELPPINGPYNVGVVDFYIPMDIQVLVHDQIPRNLTTTAFETDDASTCSAAATMMTVKHYLPARLLYPTLQDRSLFGGGIPFLNPATAIDFCRQSMRFGAPGPLKPFGWILHTWRLTTLPVISEAPILPDFGIIGETGMPLVVYSHGLGGTLDLYSYQTMALAAHGYVVLALTHMDGTAPVVPQPRGMEALPHNHEVLELHVQGKTDEYARARRAQTERRVLEFIGATEFIHRMVAFKEDGDAPQEPEHRPLARRLSPYLKRLRTDHTFFMGHSFGGTTALTAAQRRPDLVKAVIAHEPAIDWLPEDCRRSLFSDESLEGLKLTYDGGTGGFEAIASEEQVDANSIHDLDLLVLNSHDWMEKNWGRAPLLDEMHRNGRLGKKNGPSRHGVVDASHNEFSDTSMLTPLWLARPIGLTGHRNPIDTAAEIADRTRAFLEEYRRD